FNGNAGDPRSFDNLHELIKAQVFRLAQWRGAAGGNHYPRFFYINDLAALSIENEAVFTSTHGFILELFAQGKIDGLRIDHPDGLYDPAGYFRRLQKRVGEVTSNPIALPIYLVVEKITASFE